MTLHDLPDMVMAVDPAGSRHTKKTRLSSARMATVVVAQDVNRRVFVLASWADRVSTEQFMNHILDTFTTWRPRWVGIEANAMQILFGEAVELRARDRNIRLPFVPIYPPTNVDKDWRIKQAIQPVLEQGRLFVQSDQKELLQEMKDFPHSVTKDCVDVLAHAISMLPSRTRKAGIDLERENLADALRCQGVAPNLIADRLRSYDQDVQAHEARRVQ